MIGRLLQPENPRHKLHTSSRLPYLPLIPTRCSFQMGSIFWRENVLLSGKSFLKTEGKTKQEEGTTNREEESKEMKRRPSRQVRPGKKKKFLSNGMTGSDKVLEN